MKRYILFLFFTFSTSIIFAQSPFDLDPVTQKVIFTKTYQTKLKKGALYSKINEWFATTFPSSKQVIQVDDKAGGKIIGKSSFDHEYPINTVWHKFHFIYSVKVNYKDNKYRCTFTDILISSPDEPDPLELEIKLSVLSKNLVANKELIDAIHTILMVKLETDMYTLQETVSRKDSF